MIERMVWSMAAAWCVVAVARPVLRAPLRHAGATGATPRPTPPRRPRGRWNGGGAADSADLLDAIAAEVRSGSSLTASVERVAATSRTDPDSSVVLHALGAAAALGGPMAATLQHGSLVLRERHAARAEAAAHSAQARLSATVLTVLPIAFTTVAFATSASFRAAALSLPGVIAVGLGVCLNLVGRRWMHRLIASSSR